MTLALPSIRVRVHHRFGLCDINISLWRPSVSKRVTASAWASTCVVDRTKPGSVSHPIVASALQLDLLIHLSAPSAGQAALWCILGSLDEAK